MRAIRTETLAAAIATSLAAASCAPLTFAQSPPPQSRVAARPQSAGLTAVEPIRSTPQPRPQAATADSAAASTATLRWRPSSRVAPAATAQATSPLPAAEHATVSRPGRPSVSRPAATTLRDARRATPVAYLQDDDQAAGDEGDGFLPPRSGSPATVDPFLDPFNDGAASETVAPPSGERTLIPTPRPSEPLRLRSVAQQQAADPEPFEFPLESADQEPEVADQAPQTADDSLEPVPPTTNPFSARGAQESASDRAGDAGGIDQQETPEEKLRDPSARAPRYDRDIDRREEPSCDELRERIAARTIRKVSLDISPPFRPDVLAQDEYERLREEFIEDQAPRQWRSIDGELLGSGRLVDLAFENVIIESEDGQQLELSVAQLSEPDLAYVTEAWGLPRECQLPQVAFQPRQWLPIKMTWKASELCHKPLYFEEVNLERYGHTAGPFAQPVVSTAHFFFNIAVLPYKMGIHPPNECQYALGYYRPGNCAPWIIPPVPISLRGALAETAVVGGMIGLIP